MRAMILKMRALLFGLMASACPATGQQALKEAQPAAVSAALQRDDSTLYSALTAMEDAIATERRAEAVDKYVEGDTFKVWPEARRFCKAWLSEDIDAAWKQFDALVKDRPGFYWAYIGIGKVYDAWKIDDLSEANFEKARKINPQLPAAHVYLGMHYLRKEELDKAAAELNSALASSPQDPNALLGKASVLIKQGKLEEAVAALEKAAAAGGNFTIHRMLVTVLKEAGNKEGAIIQLKKCAELHPAHLATRLELAQLLQEQGQWEEAIEQMNKALAIKGEDVDIRLQLAAASGQLGQSDRQEEHLRAAAQLAPDNFDIQKRLGLLYVALNETSGAEDALRRAIEIKKDDVDVLFALARIYARWEKYVNAVSFYRKVLELRPDMADAAKALETLHEKLQVSKKPVAGKTALDIFSSVENIIRKIYKEKTKTNPKLRGFLVLKVETDSTGAVKDISFADNSLHDPLMEACIFWNIKDAKFPAEVKKFTYTFQLEMR